MSHQRVAFHHGSNYMMQEDVEEQRGADSYHVRVTTTTEWLPQHVPRYPNLNSFFNNRAPEDFYGSNRHVAPRDFYGSNHHETPIDFYGNNHHETPRDFYGSNRYEEHVIPNHAEKVHVKKHVQFAQPNQGKHKTPGPREDVNREADDFIKRKHKMMSMN